MATREDILLAKIAMKNKLVDMVQVKQCLAIQQQLTKLGVIKGLMEILKENGYLRQEEVVRLHQAFKLSEQIIQRKVAEKKFFEELEAKKEQLIEDAFEGFDESIDESPASFDETSLQKTSLLNRALEESSFNPITIDEPETIDSTEISPWDRETEEFHISEMGELEAVMLVKRVARSEPMSVEGDEGERVFGMFIIYQKLGQGGMSEVYRALDKVTKRQVALKLIIEDIAQDSDFIERLYREANHLKLIEHENIVKVFDTGIIEQRHYMAMEYVKGETLSQRASRGRLPIEEAGEIIKQISLGLQAAHEKLIIHRDIKMSNVLLSTDAGRYGFEVEGEANFNVKIADFGLARSKHDSKITQANQFMGTAKYLSPEQIQFGEVSEKSDIFALGIISYELFTGKEPYPATSSVGYLHNNVESVHEPLSKVNPKATESMEKVVDKMLAKNPEDRYDTATLIRDLQRLEKSFWGSQKIIEHNDEYSVFYIGAVVQRKKRIKLIASLVAAAVVIVALFIGFQVFTNQSDFQRAVSLLENNRPEVALQELKNLDHWGIDRAEVDLFIEEARYRIILNKALQAQKVEDWDEVVSHYKQIVEGFPTYRKNIRPRLHQAEYQRIINRGENAQTKSPLAAVEWYRKAMAYAAKHKLKEGGKQARANLDALVLLLRSNVQKFQDNGQFPRALAELELLVNINPKMADEAKKKISQIQFQQIIQRARRQEADGHWFEARNEYHDALEKKEKLNLNSKQMSLLQRKWKRANANFHFKNQARRGARAEKANRWEEALNYYYKALTLRSDSRIIRRRAYQILLKLGEQHEKKGEDKKALARYEEALRLEHREDDRAQSQAVEILTKMARDAEKAKDSYRALQLYRRAYRWKASSNLKNKIDHLEGKR